MKFHDLNDIPIPSKPELLEQLHEELAQAEVDFARISELISLDVAMSAKILKTVNSAYFGCPQKISSINHALSLLGAEATINLATGYLIQECVENNQLFPRFWDNAANMAKYCACLSNELDDMPADELYLLGLFHDVGIPLMSGIYNDFKDVLKQENSSREGIFTDLEDAAYSINHAELGGVVSREWGLSDELANVIAGHHQPAMFDPGSSVSDKERRLCTILKIAEHARERKRSSQNDSDWSRFSDRIAEFMDLDEVEFNAMIEHSLQICEG